jgi:N-methylhydantoinase B
MGRSLYPCWGINGGGKGTPNYFVIEKGNQPPRRLRKVAAESMQMNDLIRLKTGGGGGFGNPMEREAGRVLNDVIDGYITTEQAKNDYGVVVDARAMKVDERETADLRKAGVRA